MVREAVVHWEASRDASVLLPSSHWLLCEPTTTSEPCEGAKELSALALAMQNLFSPDIFRNVPRDGAEAHAAPTHHQPHPPT